jgi:hypothetical protein
MTASGRTEGARPGYVEVIALYFAPAIAFGFLLGVHRAGIGKQLSVWSNIVLWEVHFLVYWGAGLVALYVLSMIGALRRLPMSLGLLLAGLCATAIARPVYWVTYQLKTASALQAGADPTEILRPIRIFEFSSDFGLLMLELYGPNLMLWLFFCLLLQRYGALALLARSQSPVNGANEPSTSEAASGPIAGAGRVSASAATVFLERLKPSIGREIRWLKAEGHYTLVTTTLGRDLVYYRFGDAVAQVAGRGVQVHRSYWVANADLVQPRTSIEDGQLRLADGELIPIGQTYLAQLRQLMRQRDGAVSDPHPISS